MPSILNSLNIGYSGLSAAQVGINTTGNNITNAEVEGYTRKRVIQGAQTPLFSGAGNVGNGTRVEDIQRVFDNFVFDRYTSISADKEYTEFTQKSLEELSTYFPEIDAVGIKADLTEYYNMWQTFADNPDNDAIKVALAKQTETLAKHIQQTQSQVSGLQNTLNEQLAVDLNQVNDLAKELASLNKTIDTAEAGDVYTANDLRDRRNVIERSLSRLIGSKVSKGQLESNIEIGSNSNTKTGSYTVSINGFNLVDGSTYHPLSLTGENNKNGFFEVSYERQDGVLVPMEESIRDGKIGAIFDLRGGSIDSTTGVPTDGTVQTVIAQLDAFAKGLIEATNNLYAGASTTKMSSNPQSIAPSSSLISSALNINEGAFDLIVYDIDGNEVARRSINVDVSTSLSGIINSNSIEGQMLANQDDNDDGSANNDIDDFLTFNYQQSADGITRVELSMETLAESRGYTFAISDTLTTTSYSSGTNFAGSLGLGRYLDGDNASTIALNSALRDNPTKIVAGSSGTAGDNRVALSMIQQQFESYQFEVGSQSYDTTIYGMFDITATYVGISTNTAISRNETTSTQYNAVELEYFSVSKVSIDEELTNLIKYQTAYGAAAKIITTIDQMMQTLLGMKQ
ncbi:flagellar hook-associated protein FlgK [Sulfurimonas sp. SAG-AH-194-C21]|nr:flagellar hook-associated protein FlgK [Sulfurimonas sp. SAG-AH-194-C21]MDF1884283.1 flagellar hook-associated protein FlgK [Sulfurimonas sp. SAG-AH-194-C21]